MAVQPAGAMTALQTLYEALSADADALQAKQLDLMQRQANLLQDTINSKPAPELDTDPRFSDPAWQSSIAFDYVRRSYALFCEWASQLPDNAPDLPEHERNAAKFYIRQMMAAISPSNFIATNPTALNKLFATDGKSLEEGLANFKADLDLKRGHLNIRQSDGQPFVLGATLATTPGDVVMKNELMELIRYHASTDEVYERPILIIPPWINKYYVLDLSAEKSLVAWLRDQGFTVYILSWRNADKVIRDLNWDDYAALGALAAIEHVFNAHQQPINLAGYCVGGTLLATLGALMCKAGDERVASFSFLATQTTFDQPGDLGVMVTPGGVAEIAMTIVDNHGVMPGELMRDGFNALRPENLIWKYFEQNYLMGKTPDAFDLLFWNNDQTNIPGPLFLTYLRRFYLENAFAENEFELFSKRVSPKDITLPSFVHAAQRDHIAPYASVYQSAKKLGGETTFVLAESGHIAGVVSPPTSKKYGHWTGDDLSPETAEAWVESATRTQSSWWPVWSKWLQTHAGTLTAPPSPDSGAKPAPGEYVHVTLADIHDQRDNEKEETKL